MFAENLKTLRKARGLSQEELAIRLNVVRQTISKWEKGLSVPDAGLLIKIAEILEVSVTELLGAKIENEQELNAVAEQLSRINEQLAIRNRRSRRVWKGVIIVLAAFALIGVLFVVGILSLFTIRSGEARTEASDQDIAAVSVDPNTLPISIMIDGNLYINDGEIVSDLIEESRILGFIESSVPITEWPTEHGQTNFEPLYGEPYAAYQDGFAVRFHRGAEERWMLFRCRSAALPDVIDGGLRIGRYYSENGESWVQLVDSSFFQFHRHIAMSYMPNGEFYISDGKLVLRAGEIEEYVFIIRDNGLVLELESTHIEGILEQGMLFVYSDGSGN